MYGLIGKMTAVPGQRDALAAILLGGTGAMPGCLSYVIATDPAEPDALWITEVWDSQASHQASLALPGVRDAIARGRPLIAGFSHRVETTPIGGFGLGTGGARQVAVTNAHQPDPGPAAWEETIRALEEAARVAFLQADLDALRELWADRYVVNSPLHIVADKEQILGLLASGRIRHTTYEGKVERLERYGDTVVVMGSDRVTDPPDGAVSERRYTNVWQLEGGRWRSIARHAQLVTRHVPG